jgi:hypothetical protein
VKEVYLEELAGEEVRAQELSVKELWMTERCVKGLYVKDLRGEEVSVQELGVKEVFREEMHVEEPLRVKAQRMSIFPCGRAVRDKAASEGVMCD